MLFLWVCQFCKCAFYVTIQDICNHEPFSCKCLDYLFPSLFLSVWLTHLFFSFSFLSLPLHLITHICTPFPFLHIALHQQTDTVVCNHHRRHFQQQRENTEAKWSFREDYEVVYTNVQGELVVGGVFLRLFIANPGWVLRKPKEFLTELLETWSQLTSMTNPDVRCIELFSFS